MKVSYRKHHLPVIAVTAALMIAGCPLPFEYNGQGAGNSHTSDPSSPNVTASVLVSYSVQGGTSGTVGDGGSFYAGQTTTVTLSTATVNAVIFYTDNGTPLTLASLGSAKKISGSSGEITISRTTSLQSLDIRAIAIGPNMHPSPPIHGIVGVSPYPILSVTRDKASVSEDGETAAFTITSSSVPTVDITVSLVASGNYKPGVITVPPGAFTATLIQLSTTITIPITGQPDADLVDETVTLSIQDDSNTPPAYTVGAPASATVVIQDNQTPTYTVTYDGNGYTGGTVPTDLTSYLSGATVIVANPGTLVKAGYTFTSWNTAANGSGTPHAAGTSMTMGSANVVLYAIWTLIPTYSVAYNGNGSDGGAVPVDGASYPAGGTVTVLGQGSLSRSSAFFVGWNTAAGGTGTSYSGGDTFTMGAANKILYAMWVTFTGTTIDSVPLNVTNVVIPEGVTSLGTFGPPAVFPFRNHPNLTSVTIPSTVTSIPVQTFIGCPQLTTIVSSNARYQVINGALVDTVSGILMLVPSKLSGAFIIPPVTSIDPYAFGNCTNLTSITIPASLTTISGNGFSGLQSPIPIVIPSTVTAIGDFGFYNSSVTSLIMQSGTPPALGSTVFSPPLPTVHVPNAAAVTAYQADANWAATGVSIVTP